MKSPLKRILRLRSLLEDSSRSELEKRMRVFQTLDDLRRGELEAAATERLTAAENLLRPNEASVQTLKAWQQADLVGTLATQRAAKLTPTVQAAEQLAAVGRGEYLERRKERRQVEIILEAKSEAARQQADRREQSRLDDWFAMRSR
jgi:flagellar export protein FliJ